MFRLIYSVVDGDIVGLVLCSYDTQVGFGLEKKNKKMSKCGSETFQIDHMWLKKKILHQAIVRYLFLYIDFYVEIFPKEICMSESQ